MGFHMFNHSLANFTFKDKPEEIWNIAMKKTIDKYGDARYHNKFIPGHGTALKDKIVLFITNDHQKFNDYILSKNIGFSDSNKVIIPEDIIQPPYIIINYQNCITKSFYGTEIEPIWGTLYLAILIEELVKFDIFSQQGYCCRSNTYMVFNNE